MDVNDNAGCLDARVVWAFFASKLAPTGRRWACSLKVWRVHISVVFVTAAIGSALIAGYLEERQVTKRSCPTTWCLAWARHALTPALLRGSPPSAIHGRGRLNRRPAGFPTAQCLRSAIVVNGALRSKTKARRPSSRPDLGWCPHSPVGAGLSGRRIAAMAAWLTANTFQAHRNQTVGASLLAMNVNDDAGCLDARVVWAFFREQARSYREALGLLAKSLEGAHIRCCGHGCLGFRSYSGLLGRAPSNQALLPHHLVPRLGSACPHSGIAPWVAAIGHPWPGAAKPASCRFPHCAIPAFGHRG